jgi:hypothetical protein
MRRFGSRFLRDDKGSVAPTVGLALFALIAAGGLAFDYARVAAMDTELQNAADQAALAAATQLDGQADSMTRAEAAARSLLANMTVLANDNGGLAVDVANANVPSQCGGSGPVPPIEFFEVKADAESGCNGFTDITRYAEARFVRVAVGPREAVFAFTPVVGALRSGNIYADATAGLGSAICKVPPVMMCNPEEPDDNADPNFDFNPAQGVGLRLVIGSPDAPGNFGFLRTGEDGGAKEVAKTVGYDNPPNGCITTNGVETEPGNMISVRAAFNTRFDISENGELTCPDGGTCSPSRNARKDLVRNTGCGISTNPTSEDWHEPPNPYRAPNTTPLSAANPMNGSGTYPSYMGFPRDLCHAVSLDGSCAPSTGSALVGTGAWDIDAFFEVNYGWDRGEWMTNTALAAVAEDVPGVTRYDVYQWEMDNLSYLDAQSPKNVGTGHTGYASPICRGSGIVPDGTIPDRRRISVAVVNCEAQNLRGHEENVQVLKWLDVFLVEPAIARGNGPSQRSRNGDIYVEVIEVTSSGSDEAAQVTRRDVPYLVK